MSILSVFTVDHHRVGFARQAILFRLVWHDGKSVAMYVGLHPKVGEQEEEERSIHPDKVDPHGDLIVTLFHEVVLADVNGNQDKLRLQNKREKAQ